VDVEASGGERGRQPTTDGPVEAPGVDHHGVQEQDRASPNS
jgi:hypothetical protein